MTDRENKQRNRASKGSVTSEETPNSSWAEQHFVSIMGGSVFGLLALLTLVMYIINN